MKKIFAVLLVALLTLSSVGVMATPSPSADKLHKVTVNGDDVKKNGGTVKVDGGKIIVSKGVVKEGKKVTLKAKADKGKKFSKWEIDGDFTIVSGSLTSDSITIIPNGDIDVDATFDPVKGGKGEGESKLVKPEDESGIQAPDNSNISPKTGDVDDVAPIAAILLLSVSGLAAYKKRKNA